MNEYIKKNPSKKLKGKNRLTNLMYVVKVYNNKICKNKYKYKYKFKFRYQFIDINVNININANINTNFKKNQITSYLI